MKIDNSKKTKPGRVIKDEIREWVTSEDLFMGYRYKKARVEKNPISGKLSVFQPYIKQEESSSHEYALNFKEWMDIQQMYWNIVTNHLLEGNSFELQRDMGKISFIRHKPKNPVIRHGAIYRNPATMGYCPRLIWNRKFMKGFLHKSWYIFNISRKKQWSIVAKRLKKEPSIIFKYPT